MPRTIKAVDDGIKRHPLSLRTTKELRVKLERAALASGRSLAQEIEARLHESFQHAEIGETVTAAVERARTNDLAQTVEHLLENTALGRYARRAMMAEAIANGNSEAASEMLANPALTGGLDDLAHRALHEPDALARDISAIETFNAGSAAGPHEKVPSKTTRSKTAQRVEK